MNAGACLERIAITHRYAAVIPCRAAIQARLGNSRIG